MVNLAAGRLVLLKSLLCNLRGPLSNRNIECISTPMFTVDIIFLYVLHYLEPGLLFIL